MSAFIAELDNQPGELARLCEAMASSGVNLLLCATTLGNSGVVAFIADDEAAAQGALDGAGIGYLLRPALTVRMENPPGAELVATVGIGEEDLIPHLSGPAAAASICRAPSRTIWSISDDGCPSAGSAPVTSGTTVSMGVPSLSGVPVPATA